MAKSKSEQEPIDDWSDADEVFVPTGITVKKLEEWAGPVVGLYLGRKMVDSDFGEVAIHYFFNATGPFGVWGSMAIDEGMANAHIGRETRLDLVGFEAIGDGKKLRKVRIRQRGPRVQVPASLGGEARKALLSDNGASESERDDAPPF